MSRREGSRMDFKGDVTINAPRERVWAFLTDPHQVTQCAPGLQSVEVIDDSHLHVTMKMEHPDWLNVFLMTRGPDETNPSWAMHNFNKVPFWPPKPNQWRTVTIPLAKFRRKRDGMFYDEPPLVGEVAYALSISATEPDRGLVVDRMWVTRGGPGEVEAKPLP